MWATFSSAQLHFQLFTFLLSVWGGNPAQCWAPPLWQGSGRPHSASAPFPTGMRVPHCCFVIAQVSLPCAPPGFLHDAASFEHTVGPCWLPWDSAPCTLTACPLQPCAAEAASPGCSPVCQACFCRLSSFL